MVVSANPDAGNEGNQELESLGVEEPKIVKLVSFAHAVANPGAVVVVGGNALVATLAVLAPQRLLDMADGAVLILYEQDNVVAGRITEIRIFAGRHFFLFKIDLDLDVLQLMEVQGPLFYISVFTSDRGLLL